MFQPTLLAGERRPLPRISRTRRCSTHAPCGGATPTEPAGQIRIRVSTHAPCGERPGVIGYLAATVLSFSRSPLRGATGSERLWRTTNERFNPRSLRGSDIVLTELVSVLEFQPTLPLRGATWRAHHRLGSVRVSTHAPLAGSDKGQRVRHRLHHVSTHAFLAGATPSPSSPTDSRGFNPRSPCGERRTSPTLAAGERSGFNPRSPCGERRVGPGGGDGQAAVSTHAPLAGSDVDLHPLLR